MKIAEFEVYIPFNEPSLLCSEQLDESEILHDTVSAWGDQTMEWLMMPSISEVDM